MNFDIFRFKVRKDFGTDVYFQLCNLKIKKSYWSLFQLSISWNDYPSWPYLQITFGSNGLFGFVFWVYKFGLDMNLFSRTWNFDYLNKLDELEQ